MTRLNPQSISVFPRDPTRCKQEQIAAPGEEIEFRARIKEEEARYRLELTWEAERTTRAIGDPRCSRLSLLVFALPLDTISFLTITT